MKASKRIAAGVVALGAIAATSSMTAAPASAVALGLGNSHYSTTDIMVYHATNCTGSKRDVVSPGEVAQGIGTVGSVLIRRGAHGSATPFYHIGAKDHDWCWKAPTAVFTSVHLVAGPGGGSWAIPNSNYKK